jgi:hypothetical protein
MPLLASSCLPARPYGTSRLPLDRSSWNLIFEDFFFFESTLGIFKFHWNMTSITGTSRDICAGMIPNWFIFRMKNVSDKNCRENRNSLFLFNNVFFPMPPHVPYGLRGLPSRLWLKCNWLLRLGRIYIVLMRWMVIYEYEVPGGALNLSSTKLPRP